jgi:hypothetical protein
MHPVRRVVALSLALITTLAVTAPVLGAPSSRITESEARAAFKAVSVPLDDQAVITPLSGSRWDGRHFCSLDWHVIRLGRIEGGDASFTRKDAQAIFDTIAISFVLDGAALATERTRIKAVPDPSQFGFVNAYYFIQGRVMAPAELSIGQHALSVQVTDSVGTFADQITFFIDPAGTGACLL